LQSGGGTPPSDQRLAKPNSANHTRGSPFWFWQVCICSEQLREFQKMAMIEQAVPKNRLLAGECHAVCHELNLII
jgi:hypothetical protein